VNFHVGQKVVCIKRDAWEGDRLGGESFPVFNRIYTVRSIDAWNDDRYLTFDEIVNPRHDYRGAGTLAEATFRSDRFRPVVERKTDISILEAILTPQREDA
jgi:hypothetical protein